MGKASKWFRILLGAKKSSTDSAAAASDSRRDNKEEKNKWGVVRSFNGNSGPRGLPQGAAASSSTTYVEAMDANKHAIAVAAATAAVAEAALAAAQAAAEVVRLTSGGSRAAATDRRRQELAAVKIQSAFRAYLARRALRALKGLVKLQALVRGHIVRKQSADMLRRMQAMARIQARACANRAYVSEPSDYRDNSPKFLRLRSDAKSSIKNNASLEKGLLDSNWLHHWMSDSSWNSHRDTSVQNRHADDEKDDKILEIDTWNPPLKPSRSNQAFRGLQNVPGWNYNQQAFAAFDSVSRHSTQSQNPNPSSSSGEGSLRALKSPLEEDQIAAWAAESSPQVHSASSRPGSSARRGFFSPARSECPRSIFGDIIGHPNYMADTESYRAKIRSQSAPRQRIQFEKAGSTRSFLNESWDADNRAEKGSALHNSFRSKAFAGSGHMDRLRMPVQGGAAVYNWPHGRRF